MVESLSPRSPRVPPRADDLGFSWMGFTSWPSPPRGPVPLVGGLDAMNTLTVSWALPWVQKADSWQLPGAGGSSGAPGSPREPRCWSLLSQKLVVWAGELSGFRGDLRGAPSSLQRWDPETSLGQRPREKGGVCGRPREDEGSTRREKCLRHREPLLVTATALPVPAGARATRPRCPLTKRLLPPLTHSVPATPDTSLFHSWGTRLAHLSTFAPARL